ncbi:DNA-binding transcriptional regulator, GntR family [Cognatishimia maritima]|uniref:DNA-binding transcriptional regulator, GntR family n=1 Tax=Cognatishimia maritima TaxID=870908 RepID=A0A1M5LAR1_9RHOB|nr:DNA-binding transcriptional regulator, GntR family [Cognatishimia maritima]
MPLTRKRAHNSPPSPSARIKQKAKPTLAQELYRKLHQEIVTMELHPGAPISETELAADFGVSRTPIREALLRLAREDLVEVVPKSGTFVSRIPVSNLPEALIARRALENMTAKAAAKFAARSQILELHVFLERQQEFADLNDMEGFHLADESFHKQIAIVGRLPGLWTFAQQVKLQMDRFRRLTLPEPGRMYMALEEHRAIAAAIEAGEPDHASLEMDRHLTGLQLHIKKVVQSHPDFFIVDTDLDDLVSI